jgi:hypothetical protein
VLATRYSQGCLREPTIIRESPEQAQKDYDAIRADYLEQHCAFKAKYDREPTEVESITAHHLRYNQDYIDFCIAFDEIYEECMQTGTKAKGDKVQHEDEDSSQVGDEDMEDQVAEGEDDADLPDIGIPLPDLKSIPSRPHLMPCLDTSLRRHLLQLMRRPRKMRVVSVATSHL